MHIFLHLMNGLCLSLRHIEPLCDDRYKKREQERSHYCYQNRSKPPEWCRRDDASVPHARHRNDRKPKRRRHGLKGVKVQPILVLEGKLVVGTLEDADHVAEPKDQDKRHYAEGCHGKAAHASPDLERKLRFEASVLADALSMQPGVYG